MKNILLAGIMGVAVLTSCSTATSASSAAATAQSNRAEFLKLKGDWQITSVDYDNNYKVKPFDEGADAQCWVGSTWKLVPNNYSGTYTINGGGDCPTVTQPIKFEVSNGTDFKFKKIASGTKAKQNLSGYALTLTNQTDTSFTLEQNVSAGDEYVKILYNFVKTSTK